MAKLKVALIGCGGRGRSHAVGYQQSNKVKMVACADVHRDTAERLAKEFNIPNVYEDYGEMLKKEKPDVASICLWTGLHYDAVMACVDAGVKLINAEKPIAPTWGESKRMHEASEKAGVLMTFSHQRRYGSTWSKAQELARTGAVGDLVRLEGFCSNLFDWGTHWFDMMLFYNDDQPVEWVMGQVDCQDDRTVFGIPVETNGLSYIKWKNGVTGLLVTGEDHGGGCQNRIIGTDGIIEIGGKGGVRMLRTGQSEWEVPEQDPVDIPGRESSVYILDSIEWLGTGNESLTSSRRAMQATELIFATYESARRRARVYLPLEIDDSPLLSMLDSGEIVIPDYPARLSPEEEAAGFQLLFNGKDLSGWKVVGTEEAWSVERGLLTCNGEGRGWIRPEGVYTNFVLRLQYRISPKGNSGIFIRTSEEGRPAFQGMEIQLLDDRRDPITKKSTGAIYDSVAPKVNSSRAAGTWNDIEVSCQGSIVRVTLNGKEIINCDISKQDDLKDRLKSGYIGLQNHHSPIEFRGIRIQVLD